MVTIYRRPRFKQRRRSFPFGLGQSLSLQANAGSYTITGNATASNTAFVAGSGAYSISGNAVGLNLSFSASSGSYSISGGTSGFANTLRAESGTYSISGSAAEMDQAFAASSGSYAITGGAVEFIDRLAAGPGSYAITGNAATFPQVLVADGGSYVITLGQYELRRTGGDFPQVYGGIGHYLEEVQRLNRLNAITRKAPPPVTREARPNLRAVSALSAPQPQQPSQVLDFAAIIAERQRQAEAQQTAAILAFKRRQETEILLMASY